MKLLTMFRVAIAVGMIGLVGCDEIDSEASTSSKPIVTPTVAATASPQTTTTPPVKPLSPSPQATASSNPPNSAEIETLSCKITMARVNDPDGSVNVRSKPDTSANNIVGQLQNGTMVTVASEANEWFQITNPMAGWISQNRTDSSCNQKVSRVNFTPGSVSFELRDRILGSGSHSYQFTASPGQSLTVRAREGPLPIVVTPDGAELNAEATSNGASTWTGQLTTAGEYTLDFPSNFRGFTYETSVELK
jgi:uncharacterized protein YgiM (DUF1202 family)